MKKKGYYYKKKEKKKEISGYCRMKFSKIVIFVKNCKAIATTKLLKCVIEILHYTSASVSNQPLFTLNMFAQPYVCSGWRAVLMTSQSIAGHKQSKSKARNTEAQRH